MNRYPFDIQECNGTLEPKTNSDFFVKLVPKFLDYLGPTDLMKYHMKENATFMKTNNVSNLFFIFKNTVEPGVRKRIDSKQSGISKHFKFAKNLFSAYIRGGVLTGW